MENTEKIVRYTNLMLYKHTEENLTSKNNYNDYKIEPSDAAVLFLIGENPLDKKPCLILNKRAKNVRQPGDLCFPGGGIDPIDFLLSKIMRLKMSPLTKWPFWADLKKKQPQKSKILSVIFSAAVRESLEEIRLSPFKIKFLGQMPSQRLIIADRKIFVIAGFSRFQKRFTPNKEVEKILYIPIESLFKQEMYAGVNIFWEKKQKSVTYPCFIYNGETLWGATYRIVMKFLEIVFDFFPPPIDNLPKVQKILDKNYP